MSEDVLRLSQSLAGRYEVLREIGRGGMATVYLAHDPRHDRKVALKVLNPELGAVLGVERFLSEIRVTANLQHPNLLPLFDSGEADGLLFYVMPFVEGESLRARLDREKQLPVDEALRIAVAVARALDHAHASGVVHRDLKPENILLQSGQPVIADFGIALAVSNAGGARITQTGLSLGTPQYMSPEQATGDRVVDGRSDVYSLAAVLYEMLAGEPPHLGNTVQAIVAKVLTERPHSVRVARPSVPEHVARAIDRALEKLPADRWASAGDFAEALQGSHATGSLSTGAGTASPGWGSTPRIRRIAAAAPWVLAAALAAILIAREVIRKPPPSRGTSRFVIATEQELRVAPNQVQPLGFSPDEKRVAYVGVRSARRGIYVRELNDLVPRFVAGTEGGFAPSFSPGGEWIAFAVGGELKKVPVGGGTPLSLFSGAVANWRAATIWGLTWVGDDWIVFGASDPANNALWRISSSGGEPERITRPDTAAGDIDQWAPLHVPGTDYLLYTSAPLQTGSGSIGVLSLASGRATVSPVRGAAALGWHDGVLVFVREDGIIAAVPFDLARARPSGSVVPLVEGTLMFLGSPYAAMSQRGSLVMVRGVDRATPVSVGLDGATRPLDGEARAFAHPRVSPDGQRIAFDVVTPQSTDIWIKDLRSGTLGRLTTSGNNDRPNWSPDGSTVVFLSDRLAGKPWGIWVQPWDGSAPAALIHQGQFSIREAVYTPDGRSIVFREDHSTQRRNVHLLPLDSGSSPTPLVAGEFDELMARVSPDGRWLLYLSDESGQYEVYARRFPGPPGRTQISQAGGHEPLWSSDGRRIFYRQDRKMIAATLEFSAGIAVSSREVLFEADYLRHPFHPNYDVTPDGRGFVMLLPQEEESQLIAVLDFLDEVKARLNRR